MAWRGTRQEFRPIGYNFETKGNRGNADQPSPMSTIFLYCAVIGGTILVLQFALAIGALVFWEWAAVIALFVGGYLTAWAAPRDGSGPPP